MKCVVLFREECKFKEKDKNFFVQLYACKSNKGNLYYKVYKSYSRAYNFYTVESNNYKTLEEALLVYIDWCNQSPRDL